MMMKMKIIDETENQNSDTTNSLVHTKENQIDAVQQRKPYTVPLLTHLISSSINGAGTTNIQENSGGLWMVS